MKDDGLTNIETVSRNIEVNLDSSLDLTGADAEVRQAIRSELIEELEGREITGMRPFRRDGQLMFTQTWTTAVGVKQPVRRARV